MSDRKPSPFPVLLNNDVCSLIQAAEDVYQIRFKNRAANAYLVRGSSRTIMIDAGLFDRLLRDELRKLPDVAHVEEASELFRRLVVSDRCEEFLTLPAYSLLP